MLTVSRKNSVDEAKCGSVVATAKSFCSLLECRFDVAPRLLGGAIGFGESLLLDRTLDLTIQRARGNVLRIELEGDVGQHDGFREVAAGQMS